MRFSSTDDACPHKTRGQGLKAATEWHGTGSSRAAEPLESASLSCALAGCAAAATAAAQSPPSLQGCGRCCHEHVVAAAHDHLCCLRCAYSAASFTSRGCAAFLGWSAFEGVALALPAAPVENLRFCAGVEGCLDNGPFQALPVNCKGFCDDRLAPKVPPGPSAYPCYP